MVNQQTRVRNFARTVLTAAMSGSDLTATVEDTAAFPSAPCYLVIEPDSQMRREVVLFDGAATGTSFTAASLARRFLDGSAASSGIAHPVGSIVVAAPLAQHIDDLNDRVDAVSLELDGHEGAPNPHSGSASTTALGAVADSFNDHRDAVAAHGATDAATANRIVRRDAAGRAKIADPAAATDIATKGYVDSVAGGGGGGGAGLARLDSGSYTGNGESTRNISLPFRPVFVVVTSTSLSDTGTYLSGVMPSGSTSSADGTGLEGAGTSVTARRGSTTTVQISGSIGNAFRPNGGANVNGRTYRYVAFGVTA